MAPRRSTRLATSRVVAPKPAPKPLPKKPKKKRSVASKAKTGTKKRRTGLSNAINPIAALGVVDPESKINGTIQTLDNEPCDVMLVLVDPQKHMDKFFILQLIESIQGSQIVYTRWGRTGTSGQALEQSFDEYDDAVKCFEDKFAEKSGLGWTNRSHPTVGTKYRFIQQNFAEKQGGYTSATWQYWVDDGVDGKTISWYDYDPAGSVKVEQLFHENSINSRLTNRLVESGIFTYDVDLSAMTQTNVKHSNKTSRRIRRCPEGVKLEDGIPQTISSLAIPASPVKSAAIVTPSSTPIKGASGHPSPVTSSSSSTSPPVDSDIDKFHFASPSSDFAVVKDEEHDEWCDVVLNQCNITGGSNNNKYYRLQLLEKSSTGNFYTWFKWGRVGDAPTHNAQDLKGPFSTIEAALKVFTKKYKDKTANKWGDENYVAKAKKYARIQIDHKVGIKQELKSGNVKTEDIEYLPSKLHPKTKELVEVLFSSNTRDEALAAFDLDLKRLPLGVPSQQQIQAGLSILNDIEEKLNGEVVVTGSYPALSSAFYTAIPHSFKRNQRPPVINDQNSLQKRFDMCNILLDIYSQNETLRDIEKKRPVKQVSYPADSHYDSLQAKLDFVDHNLAEWKTIEKYFNTTKNSGRLINAWRVDRNGESQRFNKFDSLDNRRLLWHGTNIAVAAPILTSGLRIMSHSGGRVGSGIYLASMQQKSAQYTCGSSKFACMFLCEGALGKSHVIEHDDWTIKKPPTGYDSVLATGQIAPKTWKNIKVDKKNVSVPQSGAVDQSKNSQFHHDEFLVYDEAQVRIRYILTVKLH